jgi:histidinol-phosphate aminotransferase
LEKVTPVAHGAVGVPELAERGLEVGGVIDFSASTNPLGPPPGVVTVLRGLGAEAIGRYPDPGARVLCEALAARLGVEADRVIAGNGSSELIWLVALAYVRAAPERVLIVGPTFGEYERACRLMEARVEHVTAQAEDGFAVDAEAVARRVRELRPRVVWVCNPNNPTGAYLRRQSVETVLAACTDVGALLVMDEAYLAFVERRDTLVDLVTTGHLFLLRSMTKDYALAGVRLGYGVAAREIVAQLRLAQPPWSVSAVAQAAGLAALEDDGFLERSRGEVWAARGVLVEGLRRLGHVVVPPAANFVLFEVGGRWESAAQVRTALFQHGCVVRDCASFGLPRHVRVGVRTRAECRRLLDALELTARDPGAGPLRASSTPARARSPALPYGVVRQVTGG